MSRFGIVVYKNKESSIPVIEPIKVPNLDTWICSDKTTDLAFTPHRNC